MSKKPLALLLAMCMFMVVACSSSDGSDGSSSGSDAGTDSTLVAPAGLGGSSTTGPLGTSSPKAKLLGNDKFFVKLYARDVSQRTARRLAKAYKATHPGSLVQLTVDSAEGLQQRIAAGEQPDVILENRKGMNQMSEADLLAWRPQEFGTLVLAIAVDEGNPKGINSLRVFGEDPATRTGLCTPTKNCGKTAVNLLAQANITPRPDAIYPNATDTANAVRDSLIDATILDSTKIANRDAVLDAVRLPTNLKIVITHWQMSSVSGAPPADSFTDFMFSAAGAAVLFDRGLLPVVP